MALQPTQEQVELLKATASANDVASKEAREAFAATLSIPLRQTRDKVSTVRTIFTVEQLAPGAQANYPLDMEDISGWIMPKQGGVPQNFVEGDEIWVPTFTIASDAEWRLAYARDARFDVVARAVHKLQNSIVKIEEENGWHVLLAAADGSARSSEVPGVTTFKKDLLSAMITTMIRAGSTLTDLYLSPECMADIRDWTATDVDEVTRKEILDQAGLPSIYGIKLHVMEEFGAGREYNDYFLALPTNTVAASGEICIGLDLGTNDAFLMPVRQELTTVDDPIAIKSLKQGVIGYEELGFAVVDSRRLCYGIVYK